MLCLSRKENEVVVIADMIEVTVIEIRGNQVRLGFSAPKDLEIRRKELKPRRPIAMNDNDLKRIQL